MSRRNGNWLIKTLNALVYISLFSLGCFFIYQGNAVQRVQEKKTNNAEHPEVAAEMPTIVTWPEPVNWSTNLLFGENYTIVFESSGKETILKEGFNKHSTGIVHMKIKYNLWWVRMFRITPMNFSSIPHYFSLKYQFKNNLNAEYNVSKIGIKLTSSNNSHCGYGLKYLDGDVKHIHVKPWEEVALKIYPRKYVSSPDIEKCRDKPFNEVVLKSVAEYMRNKCIKVCRPWSYWTCTNDKEVMQIPICKNEKERECFGNALRKAENRTLSKPCTKLQYKVEKNLFSKTDGPNTVK